VTAVAAGNFELARRFIELVRGGMWGLERRGRSGARQYPPRHWSRVGEGAAEGDRDARARGLMAPARRRLAAPIRSRYAGPRHRRTTRQPALLGAGHPGHAEAAT